MRILCFVISSAASLLVFAGEGLADGCCNDIVKTTTTKEEAVSAGGFYVYFGRCNVPGRAPCAKESQKILDARWREVGTNTWKKDVLMNHTHYHWMIKGYNIHPGNVYNFEHQYQYSCWNNATGSEHTEWQHSLHFTLIVLDLQLLVVNGSGDVNAGQSLELLCSSGVPDGSGLLVEFSLGNQVAFCRPHSQESHLFGNGWMVHRINNTGDCIVKRLSVDTVDSGVYHCTAFVPDFLTQSVISSPVTVSVRESPKSRGLNAMHIIAVVGAGSILVVVIVVAFTVLFGVCLKKRGRKPTNGDIPLGFGTVNPMYRESAVLESDGPGGGHREGVLAGSDSQSTETPHNVYEPDFNHSSALDGTHIHLFPDSTRQLQATESLGPSTELNRIPIPGQPSSDHERRLVKSWDIEKKEKKERKKPQKMNSVKHDV